MNTISRPTPDQWRVARDIRLRALADSPDAYLSTLAEEEQFPDDRWKQRVVQSYHLLCWHDAAPIATAVGIPDRHQDNSREIVGMWVEPAHRGSGIGRALVEALIDWATLEEASAIALWVADGNDTARRLYERCGFEPTGERDLIREGLGEERMRRELPIR